MSDGMGSSEWQNDERREGIEITRTPRGFHRYGVPVTTDYGHTVDVRESSSALGPHVWLFAKGSTSVDPGSHDPHYDKTMHGDHVYRSGSIGVHLTPAQARAVIERLQAWLDEIPERWAETADD